MNNPPNIRVIMGLCRDNGKEHGNDYLGFRVLGFNSLTSALADIPLNTFLLTAGRYLCDIHSGPNATIQDSLWASTTHYTSYSPDFPYSGWTWAAGQGYVQDCIKLPMGPLCPPLCGPLTTLILAEAQTSIRKPGHFGLQMLPRHCCARARSRRR